MHRALVLYSLLALAACGPSNDAASGVLSTDSAGVRIVVSSSPLDSGFGWYIGETPRTTIGAAEGDETELLFRVFSARMMSDSAILVSNSGTHELRVYGADGRLLQAYGGSGEGPGEFGDLSSMRIVWMSEDSVAVADRGNGRLHVFGSDLGWGGEVRPAPVSGYGRPSLSARFRTGEWLSYTPVGSGALTGEPGDLIEMKMAFLVYDPSAAAGAPIAEVDARPRVVNRLGPSAIHFPFVPLSPEPLYATDPEGIWLNTDGSPEVRRIDRSGTLTHIFRWSPPRSSTSSVWDRFSEEYLSGVPEDRRPAYARLLTDGNVPVPDVVPTAEGLLHDPLGYVWVERFRLPWIRERTWDVLAPEGEWLGTLETPEGVEVLDIGRDYLLGRHRDELGIERIVVYDLNRAEGAP